MDDSAIIVSSLSKQYDLGTVAAYETLRDNITNFGRSLFRRKKKRAAQSELFWALKDISFEVKRGDVTAIIGRNGAGKSTLLKILSRITEPTEGFAELHGRVGSLLEVGTGFHPELTGRENIFLNGAILGMTRQEIKSRFDEIVAFSEIEKFLDTPVKRYSSGMYVRLAFAVAAHLEPEILIVDEVLAVGDQSFQSKCLGKMSSVASEGRTVLFVSHNMAAIEALCKSAILLEDGKIKQIGETHAVVEGYVRSCNTGATEFDLENRRMTRSGGPPLLRRLRVLDQSGQPTASIVLGNDLEFEIDVASEQRIPDAGVAIVINDNYGVMVLKCYTRFQHAEPIEIDGRVTLSCRVPDCRLVPGRYRIEALVMSGSQRLDEVAEAGAFEVVPRDIYGTGRLPQDRAGVYFPDVIWKVLRSSTRPVTP